MRGTLLLSLALLAAACGSGPGEDRATVAGVAVVVPGQLQQTGSMVVASLADAAGATPLAGAEVSIYDRQTGDLAATTTTGADGSFRIDSLVITHARLELRRDPASPDPDFTELLTLVRGRTVMAGAAYPVGRDDAIDAVLARAPADSCVVCSQNPLPAGTRVAGAFGKGLSHTVAEGGEWFAYVDPDPFAAFEHEVLFYFVHPDTGDVVQRDASWWPALNGVPVWSYDSDLSTFGGFHPFHLLVDEEVAAGAVFAPSSDLVTYPDPPPEPVLAGATLAQAAGVNPDDFFAVFFVASPEAWFMMDLARMRAWAAGFGLRPENSKIILFNDTAWEDSFLPGDNRFRSFPAPTVIEPDTPRKIVEESCAALEELAGKVQARRDLGGNPFLFVYATAHGNPHGEWLIYGNLLQALRGRTYAADLVLPIQKIPACRVRVMLACCYASSHVQKYFPHYAAMNPPPDVQFYTSSGVRVSNGRQLTSALWQNFKQNGIFAPPTTKPIGLLFTRLWANGGAALDFNGDVTFGPSLGFARYGTFGGLQNHMSNRPNDSICFDPGFPNPCPLLPEGPDSEPEPEPEPDSLVDYSDDRTAVTKFHRVGGDPCPDLVYPFMITNTSDESVLVEITAGNHLIGTQTLTLTPNQTANIAILFDCSRQQNFTSPVRITVTGLDTNRTETREIDVTVKF